MRRKKLNILKDDLEIPQLSKQYAETETFWNNKQLHTNIFSHGR